MPHHFTKNTVSANFWCKPCGKPTEHLVQRARRGACLACLKKLEDAAALRKLESPAAVQLGMFGGGGK